MFNKYFFKYFKFYLFKFTQKYFIFTKQIKGNMLRALKFDC